MDDCLIFTPVFSLVEGGIGGTNKLCLVGDILSRIDGNTSTEGKIQLVLLKIGLQVFSFVS